MITFSDKIAFVKRAFGSASVDNSGRNVAVRCPSCGHKSKKKFSINLDNWRCHCWVCGLKGKTVLPILKKYKDSDDVNFFLKNFYGEKIEKDNYSLEKSEDLVSLPKGFILLADNLLSLDPDVRACIRYVYRRDLSESDLWKFMLGTAKQGRFRRRIIIPSFDLDGNLNYFVARGIDDNIRRKYLNANAHKKSIIFNEINLDFNSEILITEGPFDVMKSGKNTTCLLGSGLSERSALFCKIVANGTPVVLALDFDMKKKEQEWAKLLFSYGCDVRILNLGKRSDVGEMSKRELSDQLISAPVWNDNDRLKIKINSINSGSLI